MADPTAPLVVYPLRDLVLFPGQTESLRDLRPLGAAAVARASAAGEPVLCVTQTDPRADDPVAAELFGFGTRARIVAGEVGPHGSHQVTLEGHARARVLELRRDGDVLVARWAPYPSRGPVPDRLLTGEVLERARQARERVPRLFPRGFVVPVDTDDPERTFDALAAAVSDEYARPPVKMKVLDREDPSDRGRVLKFLFEDLLRSQAQIGGRLR
jgi:Lon protease-like protein